MRNFNRKIGWAILVLIIFLSVPNAVSAPQEDVEDKAVEQKVFSYVPTIGGTVRAKFEYEPSIESYRFQVRNARVSLKGWVTPIVDYKGEVDFCDEGQIKVLDVYGRVHIKNIFAISLGQMRVPFSVGASRAPSALYFANRSFIAKQVGNVRDVGIKFAYTPEKIPFVVEAGVFNGSGTSKQKEWHKSVSASAKMNYTLNGVKLEIGGQSIKPDSIRINLFDTSLSWKYGNLFVEGEYMFKHYTKDSFQDVHAYNVFVNYGIPIKGFFKNIAFGARFDGMTNHSKGIRDDEGTLNVDDYGRKRLTVGPTLSFRERFKADIRLNYEWYFYEEGAIIDQSSRDKLVLELMVNF